MITETNALDIIADEMGLESEDDFLSLAKDCIYGNEHTPCVCMSCGNYLGELEPDQYAAYCDACGESAGRSLLLLMGVA